MGRIVELLVGVSALAGIATFLGVRTAVRRTLRSLGRKPETPQPDKEQRFYELNQSRVPLDRETREKARRLSEGEQQ